MASKDVFINYRGVDADFVGRRLIDDPNDWIRRELVTAFACGVTVIPVFTEGATSVAQTTTARPQEPVVGGHAEPGRGHVHHRLVAQLGTTRPAARGRHRAVRGRLRRLEVGGPGKMRVAATVWETPSR